MFEYCPKCGEKTHIIIPDGDHCARQVCPSCHFIHYQNPKIVTGALLACGDKVLLCQRAIEPRRGFWTIPAGFMELDETMRDGAARECMEEAGAIAKNLRLYCLFDIPSIGQIHTLYLGHLDGYFMAGTESLACQLVLPTHFCDDDLAFSATKTALAHYRNDYAQFGHHLARYPIHEGVLARDY